jgi:8-oxo-dGTP pyrophosphatase MutT (NUDIX family)
MAQTDREAEIMELSEQWGMPATRRCVLHVDQATYDWWTKVKPRRRSEVVLLIRRPNGSFILHTKDFYPAGTARVPSGGVKQGEPLLDAAYREATEETGLQVVVERFLAVILFEFYSNKHVIHFRSYLFLLRETGGELKVNDADERISGFGEVSLQELDTVAERLEQLPPEWHDWGRFRSYPHRLALELLAESARRPGPCVGRP